MEGQYRIVEAQLPLLGGVAGHNFLVLIDPNGKVVGELHGLATDASGHPKPIGNLPSDRLKGHVNEHYYQPDFAQSELVSGDRAAIMNLWNAAMAARAKMDARDIQYPWMGLGQNSNSFASTLIAAMGLNEAPMPGGASVMPGARSMLLDPKDIQSIQRQFNIEEPRSSDAPSAGARPDGVGPAGAPTGGTRAPPARNPRSAVTPPQDLRSMAVPGAKGPTSLGGPGGPAPLSPPARSQAPFGPAPAADPTLPPLHFAPEVPRSYGPFTVPGPFGADASGGPGVASAGSGMPAPRLLMPSFGAPRMSSTTSPAVLWGAGPIGDGNGIADRWNSLASAPSADVAPDSVRRLSSFIHGAAQPDPNSSTSPPRPPAPFPLEALLAPDRDRALAQWASSSPRKDVSLLRQDDSTGWPGWIASVAGRDPSNVDQPAAGGLLGMIQDYMRNNGG